MSAAASALSRHSDQIQRDLQENWARAVGGFHLRDRVEPEISNLNDRSPICETNLSADWADCTSKKRVSINFRLVSRYDRVILTMLARTFCLIKR
jgi:hypothetical protein